MRELCIVQPHIWIGTTGRLLRGTPMSQLMALYLVTGPQQNMIGLYDLPLGTISLETGLPPLDIIPTLNHLKELEFAYYDSRTETVFVREMARFQIGPTLTALDNRMIAVRQLLKDMAHSPFCKAFIERYERHYQLDLQGASKSDDDTGDMEAPPKTLFDIGPAPEPRKKQTTKHFNYIGAFEKWWKAYPAERRVGKKLAHDEWAMAVQAVQLEKGCMPVEARQYLQERVEIFAASAAGSETQYMVHPCRWLKYGRYDDDNSAWEGLSNETRGSYDDKSGDTSF